MDNIRLYRRRFVPDELIYLKNDEIVKADDSIVITKWNVINPREDFTHGISCYFIDKGFKISKFIDGNGKMVYWYCDIIEAEIKGNTYIFNDLLIDVIVYENGFVKVVDLEETAAALEQNIISCDIAVKAMKRASRLLDIIYSGKFKNYAKYIDEV